jgi:hypothetical protein
MCVWPSRRVRVCRSVCVLAIAPCLCAGAGTPLCRHAVRPGYQATAPAGQARERKAGSVNRASSRIRCRCGLRAPRHDALAAVAPGPATRTAAARRAREHGRERRTGRNTPVPSRGGDVFWGKLWCLDGCHPRAGRRRRAARPRGTWTFCRTPSVHGSPERAGLGDGPPADLGS